MFKIPFSDFCRRWKFRMSMVFVKLFRRICKPMFGGPWRELLRVKRISPVETNLSGGANFSRGTLESNHRWSELLWLWNFSDWTTGEINLKEVKTKTLVPLCTFVFNFCLCLKVLSSFWTNYAIAKGCTVYKWRIKVHWVLSWFCLYLRFVRLDHFFYGFFEFRFGFYYYNLF